MSAHTPAPWSQSHREQPDGMYVTQVYDAQGQTIADCAWYPVVMSGGVVETAREANARLIAAAPELLAALKESVEHMPDATTFQRERIRIAQAAIAKAEGRS